MVTEYLGLDKHKSCTWKCRCDCGGEINVGSQSLRSGNTKSCGCIRGDNISPDRRGREKASIVCGIYKITNPENMVYIGSSRTVYRRWLRHRESNRKIRLHDSLREFGWRRHEFKIIHELPLDIDDKTLIKYEQLYIDCYKDCGVCMLNVKEAGSAGRFTEESKIKMALSHIGKPSWNKGLRGGNKVS